MLLSVLSILILSSCWIDMLRSEGEECCPLKEVGGKQYSFVDHITKEEAKRLDCTSTCTYKYAKQPSEKRFCFKPGNLKSICPEQGSTFSVLNGFTDNVFYLSAAYSNSSCNTYSTIGVGLALFPNEEYCGPQVTLTANSYFGDPHFSCHVTTTYEFPNLVILPDQTGLFEGCKITTTPEVTDQLDKNIVALEEAKTTVRGYYGYPYRMRNIKAAAGDCTQFTVLVDQLVGLPPENPEIVTVAASIVASDVTCTEEQKLELGQALIALDELIARAEALLAYLQTALEDATSTTAVFSTTTATVTLPQSSTDATVELEVKDCPAGYVFYDKSGKCYKAVWNGGGISRNDAQNECAAEGGYLASIHNAETNNFLLGLLQVRSYIGGVYENGQWTWTDGSPWDYENWRAGDPENPEVLKYAEFDYTLTGVWHNEDNTIGYDNGYICQREVLTSGGTYSIKNGFKNAVAQCNGTYLESNNIINPGLTSNVQISATVSCSADIENKVVDCSTYTGAIKDLVITPVDQSCIVKADTTPSAGSFNIKNNLTNAETQCIGVYFDSKIAINPELTRDVQISVTVSCSANIEGTTVNCGTYTGTIQDLVIEPVEQSCFVVPKSSPDYVVDEEGLIILPIQINNTIEMGFSGEIYFVDDNSGLPYEVEAGSLKDIVTPEQIVQSVSGVMFGHDGMICDSYNWDGKSEPARKFKIVPGDLAGCKIVPESEQYHLMGPTYWLENGELVSQQDFFHPGTREAILKTEAHAGNHETTMIFQAKEATQSRRSAGFGLMVTAAGAECHVNELNDDIGVNPEHMLSRRYDYGWGGCRFSAPYRCRFSAPASRTYFATEESTTHKYVTNPITTTKIISPDDENVKLTETMKKACEGKTIYHNSNHYVDSYRSMVKGGVIGDRDGLIQHFKRTTPQLSNNTFRMGERGFCSDVKDKFSTTTAASCGTWSYGGVTTTEDGISLPEKPIYNHFHSIWTVQAQCCNDARNAEGYYDTQFFPCEQIPEGNSAEAEQAFSTAYALSTGKYYFGNGAPFCMGISRFCEWSDSDLTYADFGLTVPGACTSRCTSYCNNFQHPLFRENNYFQNVQYPNGCFKCFGMYPGFLNPADPYYVNPDYLDHYGWYRGPCTA